MQNARPWQSVRPRRSALAAALAVMLCAGMAGCSSVIDAIPTAAGGLPSGAPERPATAPDYLPVGDTAAARENRPLTEAERLKLEAELAAMRSQQEQRAVAPPVPAAAGPARNPKTQADAAKASQAAAPN